MREGMRGAAVMEGGGAEDQAQEPVSGPGVRVWDTRLCEGCGRDRVHGWVDGRGWVCIGKLGRKGRCGQ